MTIVRAGLIVHSTRYSDLSQGRVEFGLKGEVVQNFQRFPPLLTFSEKFQNKFSKGVALDFSSSLLDLAGGGGHGFLAPPPFCLEVFLMISAQHLVSSLHCLSIWVVCWTENI